MYLLSSFDKSTLADNCGANNVYLLKFDDQARSNGQMIRLCIFLAKRYFYFKLHVLVEKYKQFVKKLANMGIQYRYIAKVANFCFFCKKKGWTRYIVLERFSGR